MYQSACAYGYVYDYEAVAKGRQNSYALPLVWARLCLWPMAMRLCDCILYEYDVPDVNFYSPTDVVSARSYLHATLG